MERERLTITLRKDILKQLDHLIDGITLRNRSHAIESFLERALMPKVKQALILAGGEGVKMRPFTYEIPKALIPVHGKALLEYLVESLRESDVRNIVIAIGYLGDRIKEHFGDGRKFGVSIKYSEEEKPLGTAGAIRQARRLLDPDTFIVTHGDILVDMDFQGLATFHREQGTLATIALTTASETSAFGIVRLRGSQIVEFIEKPEKEKVTSLLVNSGIYVFEAEIFKVISKGAVVMLEDIFPILAKENKLSGFPFEGRWFDVSTPQNYERAINLWRK